MAEAKLTIDTKTEVTLVPMLIRPGDTVLIPLEGRVSMSELERIMEHVAESFPGVKFRFIEGSPMRHALVYRPKDEVQFSGHGVAHRTGDAVATGGSMANTGVLRYDH